MLRIRLMRFGKKNAPSFRLVVVPSQSKPKGKYIEKLGHYNPITKEQLFNKERILYWLSQGAKPSDSAYNLLIKAGIIKGPKAKISIRSKRDKENKQQSPETSTVDQEKKDLEGEETDSKKEQNQTSDVETEKKTENEDKKEISKEG